MLKFHTAVFCSPHVFSTWIYLIPQPLWENADIHQEQGITILLPVNMYQNGLHSEYEITQRWKAKQRAFYFFSKTLWYAECHTIFVEHQLRIHLHGFEGAGHQPSCEAEIIQMTHCRWAIIINHMYKKNSSKAYIACDLVSIQLL